MAVTKLISIEFEGSPGDSMDLLCASIFETYGGEFIHSGTFLSQPPVRDMTYAVPKANVRAVREALKEAKANHKPKPSADNVVTRSVGPTIRYHGPGLSLKTLVWPDGRVKTVVN
jgi:hypothetical protein